MVQKFHSGKMYGEKNHNSKIYMHIPMLIAALFMIVKTSKQPKCSLTHKWIKKMWCIYTVKCYSTMEKNEIMKIFSNRDGPRGYHTK